MRSKVVWDWFHASYVQFITCVEADRVTRATLRQSCTPMIGPFNDRHLDADTTHMSPDANWNAAWHNLAHRTRAEWPAGWACLLHLVTTPTRRCGPAVRPSHTVGRASWPASRRNPATQSIGRESTQALAPLPQSLVEESASVSDCRPRGVKGRSTPSAAAGVVYLHRGSGGGAAVSAGRCGCGLAAQRFRRRQGVHGPGSLSATAALGSGRGAEEA